MHILRTSLVTSLLLFIVSDLAAVSSFTAEYDLSKGVLKLGVMTRRLEVGTDDSYVFESRMEPNRIASLFSGNLVVETSRGRIKDSNFIPDYYHYNKDGDEKDYELSFDYDSKTVRRSDTRESWSAPMPDLLHDKLSYQAQLMLDVATNPHDLSYAIADRRKLKRYEITNLGPEDVETDAGLFKTLKMERANPGSRRRTTVWYAETLGWMPIKVEYRDKHGGLITGLLRRLTPSKLQAVWSK